MTRDTEARLLQFCAQQQSGFRADDWLGIKHPDTDEMAVTCLFLAGVDWYGHSRELISVAERLHPGSTGHVSELVQKTGFDCSRFSNMLRRELRHALVAS